MLRKTGYRTSGVYEVGIKYESDRNERVSVKTSGEFLGRDRSGNDDFKYRSHLSGLPGPETFFSRKVTRKMKRSMKNGKEAIQTR